MNTKNIAILAIVTLIVVMIAAQFSSTTHAPEDHLAGQAFFPELLDQLKDVDSIHIQTATDDFTVEKKDDTWGLTSSHHYPVAMDKVSKVLNGMASFVLLEKKTANPALHPRLELMNVTTSDAKSSLIELKQAGNTVASALLGKTKVAKSDNTRTEIYLRKPAEDQTWLVMGTLNYFSKTSNEWLDKTISDIDAKRIRAVSITRIDMDAITISKQTESDTAYTLSDLPENAEVSEAYKLQNIASSLDGLNLDDVVPLEGFEFDDSAAQVVFNSFDGLEVTAKVMAKDGKHYLSLQAVAKSDNAEPIKAPAEADENKAGDPPKLEETTEQHDMRIAKEVEDFNQKVSQWVYLIPEYKYKNLLPKKEELFKLKEAVEESVDDADTDTSEKVEVPSVESSPASIENMPSISIPPATETAAPITQADFATMLKQAAERAKQQQLQNPQAAMAHPITAQNEKGETINLPDLFRQAAEKAKKEAEARKAEAQTQP